MRDHPKEGIPGIAKVEIVLEHPEPVTIARVYEQLHFVPKLHPTVLQHVQICQAEIKKSILSLEKNPRYRVDHMVNEGQVRGEVLAHLAQRFGYDINDPPDTPEELGRWGAAEALHKENNLLLYGAEDPEVYALFTTAIIEGWYGQKYDEVVFTKRNWEMIKTLDSVDVPPNSLLPGRIRNLCVGCAHDIKETMKLWNVSHPKRAMSVMRMVPHIVYATCDSMYDIVTNKDCPGKRIFVPKSLHVAQTTAPSS